MDFDIVAPFSHQKIVTENTQNLNVTETAAAKSSKTFQVMMISQFIQPMLEESANSMFGENVAGDLYKTQFASALAEIIAARGGIGLENITDNTGLSLSNSDFVD